jgi:hypothetical protein
MYANGRGKGPQAGIYRGKDTLMILYCKKLKAPKQI